MSMKNFLSIVIPVKNEEGSIINTLLSIKRAVKIQHSIIVVDGCSTDKTVHLVRNYIRENKNVSVLLTTPRTSGFKNSIDIGIEKAKTEFVVVMMGDLCDDPKTINEMYRKANSGFGIIVGSRYMRGGKKLDDPKIQGFISRVVNRTLYLLTGIPTHDASNPFKLYRKSLLSSIKPESKGNEIPIEVIFRAYFQGARIIEVPTTWKGRKSGKSKFKMLRLVPGYAKLYAWVLLNSWRLRLARFISPSY